MGKYEVLMFSINKNSNKNSFPKHFKLSTMFYKMKLKFFFVKFDGYSNDFTNTGVYLNENNRITKQNFSNEIV